METRGGWFRGFHGLSSSLTPPALGSSLCDHSAAFSDGGRLSVQLVDMTNLLRFEGPVAQ